MSRIFINVVKLNVRLIFISSSTVINHCTSLILHQIPVLRQLRDIERDAGKPVLLKGQAPEDEDPLENAEPPRPRRFRKFGERSGERGGYRGGRGGRFRYANILSCVGVVMLVLRNPSAVIGILSGHPERQNFAL